MKVLSFLEWFELHHGFNGVGTTIEGIQTVTLKMQSISNYYSQPFKPEMISELFKGWEKIQNGIKAQAFRNQGNAEAINFDAGGYSIYGNGNFIRYNAQPKTLDHFITDCQRAGIELTWKPEVINKYFK